MSSPMIRSHLLKSLLKPFLPPISFSTYSTPLSSSFPSFGIMFDIDGVIVRGKNVLPSAPEAFHLLVDKSTGTWRVPTI